MKRLLKVFFIAFVFLSLSLLVGYFIYATISKIWIVQSDTLQKADGIIVVTGSQGRIDKAFELFLENKADHLFISGINKDVRFEDILSLQNLSDTEKNTLRNHCCITLDYQADTTEANARLSKQWIAKNNIKTIILVTATYHMPRALFLFRSLMNKDITITPYPVKTMGEYGDIFSYKFWKLTAREYMKFLGQNIRLAHE